jgi:hypothetical protein
LALAPCRWIFSATASTAGSPARRPQPGNRFSIPNATDFERRHFFAGDSLCQSAAFAALLQAYTPAIKRHLPSYKAINHRDGISHFRELPSYKPILFHETSGYKQTKIVINGLNWSILARFCAQFAHFWRRFSQRSEIRDQRSGNREQGETASQRAAEGA